MADEAQVNTNDEQDEQHETDWKAEARKWEQLAKKNFDKAKQFDEMEEASKSELQKAQERAKKLEEELKSFKTKAERSEAASKIAQETGVPASLIVGETEEDMRSFAQAIADYAKPKAAPKQY